MLEKKISSIISYSVAVMLITALGTEMLLRVFSHVLNFSDLLPLEGIKSSCFSSKSMLTYPPLDDIA